MIVGNWNPKTKVINGKKIKVLYEKTKKLNTNTLSIWRCDDPKCRTPKLLHSVRYGHLKNNISSNCNLEKQICKSCQHMGEKNHMYGKTHTDKVKSILRENIKKSQKTIKEIYGVDNISKLDNVKINKGQFIVNFENVKNKVYDDDYTLLNIKGDNQYSILTLKCPNGHIFEMKYLQYRTGHRCVECFYERLRLQGITNYYDFILYKKLVIQETKKSFRKYKRQINLNGYKLGRGNYHLDHRFSICEGYKQNVEPKIIGSKYNLEVITEYENCSKQSKCSISLEDLLNVYYGKN